MICLFCSTSSLCCKLNYSMLMHCSLITYRAQLSRALCSAVTPSCKRWSISQGSTAIFNPTNFRLLIMDLLASFSVVSAPACGVRTYNSCSSVQRAPNTNSCFSSNCWRAFVVTSLTISLISCRSPSVNVFGSKDVFEALVFFRDTTFSCSHRT